MPAHREPSAEIRSAVKELRAMFNALVDEGFTEDQALQLCMSFLGRRSSGEPG